MAATLPQGSLVLVSGANGFIGSHLVDELIKAGYKVRGTVRDVAKNDWLVSLFDKKYGQGKLELVQVPDAGKEGAFDDAVKGVSAFAHVASDLSLSPDPNAVITPVIASVKSALKSATLEPSLKSFVLTSSIAAATKAYPNKKFHVSKDTWNEVEIKEAWAPAPYEPERAWAVYGASKALGEQAAWEFVKDNKPHYTFNTILPGVNFGAVLDPAHQYGSTASWVFGLLGEGFSQITTFETHYYVDVVDIALLHVAALTDQSINGQRLFGLAEPFTWNEVLEIIRKVRPDLSVPENLTKEDRNLSTVENGVAEEILKSHFNKSWTPIEQAIKENLAHISPKA